MRLGVAALPLLLLLPVTTARAHASPPLPDVPLPPGVVVNEPTLSQHDYARLAVTDPKIKTAPLGKYLRTYLSFENGQQSAQALWSRWKPLLEKSGWRVVHADAVSATLTRSGERWLVVRLGDYQDPLIEMILAPSKPTRLVATPPTTKPEPVADSADFPFVPRFPGATLTDTAHDDAPFLIPGDKEARIVANGTIAKRYTPPKTLSKRETAASYGDALVAAGWTVLPHDDEEGVIVAHYAKNGRDLWTTIGRAADDSDQGLRIVVADVGREDWGATLDRECKLQLLGVHFDFDKATLRPDSLPVLDRVAALVAARATQRFEVSGHTDNVGDTAYNQRLSQQRAEAVLAYLVAHGGKRALFVAKGYGLSQPIADNDSDLGRARNRRVQLACLK